DGEVVAEQTVTFTMEDAKRAGLAGKDNWKHYPRQMLRWRAVTEVSRFLFADLDMGTKVTYTADEMGDDQWTPDDDVTQPPGGGYHDGEVIDHGGPVLDVTEESEESDEDEVAEAVEILEETFDAEVVEEADEDTDEWGELYALLGAGPDTSSKPKALASAERVATLMEAVELWPAGALARLEEQYPESFSAMSAANAKSAVEKVFQFARSKVAEQVKENIDA
ncbi:MAG: hypothetical protein R3324_07720, partial [Halobacteriales archaeon]|nr:hypothetical protein [Halobacteriales archaeon]